ncbi:cell division protein FtsL [bacterium BMS3Abin01]|nr:cell division protein FtsL [bacterium BMS3Abin01]HDY69603.1 hypothetical protein [Actinomycetota bacterium]
MAGATQKDWGFSEITAKFEQQPQRQRRQQSAPEPAGRVQLRARRMVHTGFWLSAVAICLIGLVALHVGILKKNIEYNQLVDEKNTLSADNSRLSSEVAALRSPQRIEEIATGPLGMVAPETLAYVYIGPSGPGQDYAQLDNPEGAGYGLAASP